jgi:hypothetical protein
LLVAGLLLEKSTAGWWLISQANSRGQNGKNLISNAMLTVQVASGNCKLCNLNCNLEMIQSVRCCSFKKKIRASPCQNLVLLTSFFEKKNR